MIYPMIKERHTEGQSIRLYVFWLCSNLSLLCPWLLHFEIGIFTLCRYALEVYNLLCCVLFVVCLVKLNIKTIMFGDGSAVKSARCSSRGLGFNSQHLHDGGSLQFQRLWVSLYSSTNHLIMVSIPFFTFIPLKHT